MRQRHKPWAKEKIAKHRHIVVPTPEQYQGNWSVLFENDAPLHVEIGTGKGKFLDEMAENHPNVNFLGIEVTESVIVSALDRLLDGEKNNAKLLHVNANDITSLFANGEVERIYLNFSDPWPKNRHEKRRLTYQSFLSMYEDVLTAGGEIHLKTDNQGFFEYSLFSFSKYGMLLKNVSLDLHRSDFRGNVMTEYEKKFSEKGQRIYRCEAEFRNL